MAGGAADREAPTRERLTQFKAIFLYNFVGYVTWPEERQSGDLVVLVVGESDVVAPLRDIAGKRQVNGRSLEVRASADVENLEPCHLLYVPAGQADRLEAIGEQVKGKSVLTVADVAGAALRGEAAISFVMVDGKLKFEINQQALAAAGLWASSHLLRLGILAEETGE